MDFNTRGASFAKREKKFLTEGISPGFFLKYFFWWKSVALQDDNWIVFEADRARTGQFTHNPVMKSDLCQLLCKPIVRNQVILCFLWTLSFTNHKCIKHKINYCSNVLRTASINMLFFPMMSSLLDIPFMLSWLKITPSHQSAIDRLIPMFWMKTGVTAIQLGISC